MYRKLKPEARRRLHEFHRDLDKMMQKFPGTFEDNFPTKEPDNSISLKKRLEVSIVSSEPGKDESQQRAEVGETIDCKEQLDIEGFWPAISKTLPRICCPPAIKTESTSEIKASR